MKWKVIKYNYYYISNYFQHTKALFLTSKGALPFITYIISITKFHQAHITYKVYWCYSKSSEFYYLGYVPIVDQILASKRYV